MARLKRRNVTEILTRISLYDLEQSLDEVLQEVNQLKEIVESHGYHTSQASIELRTDEYGDTTGFNLAITRLENDKEYEARVYKHEKHRKEQLKIKEKTEAEEKKLYVRLFNKFKGKDPSELEE